MNTLSDVRIRTYAPKDSVLGAAFPRFRLPAALALPGVAARRFISLSALAVMLISAGTYVAAVNAILLHGQSIRASERTLAALETERTRLESIRLVRQSPAFLASSAERQGMVPALGVRYLTAPPQVALSR